MPNPKTDQQASATIAEEKSTPKKEVSEPRLQGKPVTLYSPEAHPDPVDGRRLIDELSQKIGEYLVVDSSSRIALSLWAIGTHLFMEFPIFPRLALQSSTPRAGKTTALRILNPLVRKPLKMENITSAALFRLIECAQPTLLIDETDTFITYNEEMRGILNSGHLSDGSVIRLVGEQFEPRSFRTFSPAALAGIGSLPETIEDRCIVVELQRRHSNQPVSPLDDEAFRDLRLLGSKCTRWTQDNVAMVRARRPAIPVGLNDRAADNWRPLLAIAALMGEEIGVFAADAAIQLSANAKEKETTGLLLLKDMCDIFQREKRDRLHTEELLTFLPKLQQRPWSSWKHGMPIGATDIANLLKQFGVKSVQIWISGKNLHGYLEAACREAQAKYV